LGGIAIARLPLPPTPLFFYRAKTAVCFSQFSLCNHQGHILAARFRQKGGVGEEINQWEQNIKAKKKNTRKRFPAWSKLAGIIQKFGTNVPPVAFKVLAQVTEL
jgi:hypothetical protein